MSQIKIAPGVASRTASNQAILLFVVEGAQMQFLAVLETGVLPFTSASAFLSYKDKATLTGTNTISSGKISAGFFSFNFDNGNVVYGYLDTPVLSDQEPIKGTGTWTNFSDSRK